MEQSDGKGGKRRNIFVAKWSMVNILDIGLVMALLCYREATKMFMVIIPVHRI